MGKGKNTQKDDVVDNNANVQLVARKEAIEAKEKELETLKKELETKTFLVDVDDDIVNAYVSFIKDKAPWKYSEAVGVIQVHADLSKAIKEAKIAKIKGIMLPNVALEAMNYFYSLASGVGLTEAEIYMNQVKPLALALQTAKSEMEELNRLEFELASMREGIAIAEPIVKGTAKATDDVETV